MVISSIAQFVQKLHWLLVLCHVVVMALGVLLHRADDMHIRILLVDNLLFFCGNCNHCIDIS